MRHIKLLSRKTQVIISICHVDTINNPYNRVLKKKQNLFCMICIYMYHSKFAQVSMDKVCKMHSVQKLWQSLKCSWKGKREGILPLKYANFNLC